MASARRAGVRRVVLTSSVAALRGSGQKPRNGEFFTSDDWNTVSTKDGPGMEAYQYGKTQSEKEALQFGREHGIEVVSILPTFLLGPPRSSGVKSASLQQVRRWLRGEGKVQTRLICDVRDAARAHLAAAEMPGEALSESRRFIVGQERRTSAEELRELLIRGCLDMSLPAPVSPADDWIFSEDLKGDKEVETSASLRALGIGSGAEHLLPVAQTVGDMLKVLLQETAS
ncbi:hypothetical protein GUITHDRAFT_153759 [Guillardia theta CCMP2712]|uniref:NAD-dependent epimerase/dehydratase domain-containing protein n=1 Tax=Guillardia theta (strain CCMP2712) TaxID=905079 RepID=L1J123_GUITC|nr:hypothetical protein GUITHDRAFT_153759 [Guillardia theta CCMP2712]EKX41819.1 hypothetical protein GUITHDRAFT_153759 [Guillardia theta CCMP2712]|eukprot:XP_005828799.1 hypothetical protein GUITHDRAFT_153759 [Guillardia theta CCMP2712]